MTDTLARRNTLLNGYGSARVLPPTADFKALEERIRTYASAAGWTLYPLSGQCGTGLTAWQRDQAAEEMMDDEAVKTGVLQKCFGVMPLTLQTLAADPTRKADRQAAEFCRWAICDRIKGGAAGVMWSLLHGLRGHVVCEPVWRTKPGTTKPQLEESGRWRGKHSLHALKARPKRSYQLEVDDYSEPLGVTADNRFLPVTRDGEPGVVLLTFLPHYEDPRGRSDFDAAISLWLFKVMAWRLRKLYLDRLVGPYIHATSPGALDAEGTPGHAKATALATLLMAARSCGVIVTDSNDVNGAVNLIDLAGSSDDQFDRGIQRATAAIIMNFTGAYLHTMESKESNPSGSAASSKDVSEGHQWYLRALIETTLTQQVFPLLTKRNFAKAGSPKAVLEVINPAYAKAMLEVGLLVKQAGLPTSKAQWYGVSGWQPGEDAEDAVPGNAAPVVPKMGPDGKPVPDGPGDGDEPEASAARDAQGDEPEE